MWDRKLVTQAPQLIPSQKLAELSALITNKKKGKNVSALPLSYLSVAVGLHQSGNAKIQKRYLP
jgi:hypothetical protein